MNYTERAALRDKAEPLIEAILRATQAAAVVEAARSEYQGYSFEWFYQDEIEAAENAGFELVYQIEKLIEAKIKEAQGSAEDPHEVNLVEEQ